MDNVAGRPVAARRVQAEHAKRPVGADEPRPAAVQRGHRVRFSRALPVTDPGQVPARGPGASRRGRAHDQRQHGVGQHALDPRHDVVLRARRARSRRNAHITAKKIAHS